MKVISLFDGISCARVALERAGIPVEEYYASEIDKYAIEVSQKNYPEITHIGSVTEVNSSLYKDIDLLIGGSPCQDLSIAKRDRKGLDGERSGLFWEYVRILNEVKPKYFILENVNSMPKEAKDEITKTLGVEPIMINASLVSAQNRKRLFWTNIPNVTQPEDKGILLKDILIDGIETKEKSLCVTATYSRACPKDYFGKSSRQLIKVGHFNKGGQGDRIYSVDGKSVTLSALGGGRGAKTGLYHVMPMALRNRGHGKQPEYNKTGKANAMTTVQTDSMVDVEGIYRN
jgi:DNA (cytosine-5)-methyltransferase 3A